MTLETKCIESPNSRELDWLCSQLRELASTNDSNSTAELDSLNQWPTHQLDLVSQTGVYRWFVPESLGGIGWTAEEVVSGYVQLASACLTTAFIITQRVAAITRICAFGNEALRARMLPGLLTGAEPATVGISHLTTSRQHMREPVLKAAVTEDGFLINGYSPWVTGASGARNILMGAEMNDGRQVLFVVPTDSHGVTIEPGFDLVALSGSQTGPVKCVDVLVDEQSVLAGPVESVLSKGPTPFTGSFQTSALATGLTQSAIDFIRKESNRRPELNSKLKALEDQQADLKERLFKLAAGVPVCSNEELRTEANSLVLRATQAAMVVAKGTGFVKGHPVGRWCQEALFFLVWSCPQAVLNANLCELAGIEE
jgi:alkylation response protein AidB-like acyl-CoA dehydrogenase